MRLSCLPVSFFDDITQGRMTIAEWARLGADIGLDGIDLTILFTPNRSLKRARRLREVIENAGVCVTMVSTYPDLSHPDPSRREQELKMEQEAMAGAKELGAELVRVTAGQAHPETRREEGIAWATEGLIRLVETTRHLGVTPVYENHGKPDAWTYADFSQSPDIFLEIARRTAEVGLGINFDVANATAYAADPLGLLEEVIDRVVSVHAADIATRGRLQYVPFGTGRVDFQAIFARLQQAGWDNWICIEEATCTGPEGVREAADFVRGAWKEVHGSGKQVCTIAAPGE